jgi:hypothetical protein
MTAIRAAGHPDAAAGSSAAPAAVPASSARPKKHKDRGAKFNEKHALKYGLSVCSRNAKTATVETVMCKFCVAFGKESAADATRKRRATANIKYFRQPFRADHYLSHLEINHKLKWAEYEHAPDAEKEKFFANHMEDVTVKALSAASQQMTAAAANGASASSVGVHLGAADLAVGEAAAASTQRVGPVRLPASEIEKSVVEVLVGELFFNPSDEDGVSKEQALAVFARKSDSENYEIVIKNQRLYDLAIKFVSCGASFRLAARMIQCTKEETKFAYYGGCSEHKVAGYVRAVLASNLQKIALMMRSAWAYAIATDAGVHQSTCYLDIRVRMWQSGALQDFHLFSLPTFDQYPALSVMQRIEKCLDVLDPLWRGKLLGTTTNGGINTGRNIGMTGSQQGISARLTTLVTKPGFFLIWCGVHQLELVVKNCVTSFCQKAFYDELVTVLAALRRQEHLQHHQPSDDPSFVFNREDLPDVTSAYTSTRGFSHVLMQALKWLIEHRVGVTQFLERCASSTVPSASWWVCVAVAHRVMAEIEYFMKKLVSMESGANLVSDQVQELCKLALIMADVVGARRDLWDSRDTEDACAAGSFLLTYQNAQQFIQNEGGPLAIEMFDTLRGVERQHMSKSVAHFAVDLIAGVATIAQDGRHYCAEDVGVLVNPPCVMPIEVFEMGKEAFMKVLEGQEPRLRESFGDEDMKAIERDFDDFVLAVAREPILSGVLKKHGRETDVSFAWSCLTGRFRMLQEFVGGLACVVPEAAAGTLASDLTLLNWAKPDYRQTMVDFALEGILHARQKTKVELVDINYLPPSVASGSVTSTTSPTSQRDEDMAVVAEPDVASVDVVAAVAASAMTPLAMNLDMAVDASASGFMVV